MNTKEIACDALRTYYKNLKAIFGSEEYEKMVVVLENSEPPKDVLDTMVEYGVNADDVRRLAREALQND